MDARTNELQYRQAGELYRQGCYEEAMEILDGLCRQYPDTARLMYPRAQCLAKMGRVPEAVAVCDALIRQFDYPRAKALKEYLVASVPSSFATPAPFSGDGGDAPDFDVQVVQSPFSTPPPARAPLPPPRAEGVHWRTALLLMVATAGVAAALGFAWARGYLPFP